MITDRDPADTPLASTNDHPADHILEANCPHCRHAVDAICPECRGHLEPAGAGSSCTLSTGVRSVLSFQEYNDRMVRMLNNAKNTKFMLVCYMIAIGHGYADGVTMTEVAAQWGCTKANVSKQCRFICNYLGIPPSKYMRKESTAAKFKFTNRRPIAPNKI